MTTQNHTSSHMTREFWLEKLGNQTGAFRSLISQHSIFYIIIILTFSLLTENILYKIPLPRNNTLREKRLMKNGTTWYHYYAKIPAIRIPLVRIFLRRNNTLRKKIIEKRDHTTSLLRENHVLLYYALHPTPFCHSPSL
jgi:hypothetical protein